LSLGETVLRLTKSVVSLGAGLLMTYLGYKFFMLSIGVLVDQPPRATAGLMAGLAGFTFIAAAVTLLRDWLIVERAEKGEAESKLVNESAKQERES